MSPEVTELPSERLLALLCPPITIKIVMVTLGYYYVNNLKRLRFPSVIMSNVMITVCNYLANFQCGGYAVAYGKLPLPLCSKSLAR